MRVGNRIREVLAIAERLGPCTYSQVHPLMDGAERTNVWKYCSRAVGLGLMTVDRTKTPFQFAVVPGWQSRVDNTKRLSAVPKPIYTPQPCALQDAWRMTA